MRGRVLHMAVSITSAKSFCAKMTLRLGRLARAGPDRARNDGGGDLRQAVHCVALKGRGPRGKGGLSKNPRKNDQTGAAREKQKTTPAGFSKAFRDSSRRWRRAPSIVHRFSFSVAPRCRFNCIAGCFLKPPRLGDDARIGHFLPITEQQLPARYKALAAFSSAAILASSFGNRFCRHIKWRTICRASRCTAQRDTEKCQALSVEIASLAMTRYGRFPASRA